MYTILKTVIEKGQYDLERILTKIDTLWAEGKLSDSQREELTDAAREKATAKAGVDVQAKLAELEQRLRALEQGNSPAVNDVPEYASGKWYYAGDRCSYAGKVYACVAPAGVVCVWSPEVYPAYWEVV